MLCLILDLVVRREQNARGRYAQAPEDIKLDNYNTGYDGRRDSGGPFDVPRGYDGQHDGATVASSEYDRGFGNEYSRRHDDQQSSTAPASSRFESGYGNDHHAR